MRLYEIVRISSYHDPTFADVRIALCDIQYPPLDEGFGGAVALEGMDEV